MAAFEGRVAVQDFTTAATGNLDIVQTDLQGLTPKGAIIVITGHNTANDGGTSIHASMCIGFTDGTRHRYQTTMSEDNVADTDCYRDQGTSNVILLLDGTGAIQVAATFVSFSANTMRINFGTFGFGATIRGYVIFFAGPDVSCHCNTIALGTGTSILDETNPGFQPSIVFSGHVNSANATGVEAFFGLAFGITVDDGSATQAYMSWAEADAIAAGGNPSQIISTLYGLGQQNAGAATEAYHLTFSAFDGSGFSVTPSASAGSDDMNYLAVRIAGASVALLDISTPTSTGNQSYTPGFRAQTVVTIATNLESRDTPQFDTALAGGLGICAFTATEAWGAACRIDNVDPSDTANVTNSTFALIAPNGAVSLTGVLATLVSFDADGVTLNYTQVEAAAKMAVGLFIQYSGAAAGSISNSVAVSGVGRATAASSGSVGVSVGVSGVGRATAASAGVIAVDVAVVGVGRATFSGVGAVGVAVGVAGVGTGINAAAGAVGVSVGVAGVGRATAAAVGAVSVTVTVAGVGTVAAAEGVGAISVGVGVAGVGTASAVAVGAITNTVTVAGVGLRLAIELIGSLPATPSLTGSFEAAVALSGGLASAVALTGGLSPSGTSLTGSLPLTANLIGDSL